eukprot:scaffold1803_cov92-Amphora_coffeaeformis.AAC.47
MVVTQETLRISHYACTALGTAGAGVMDDPMMKLQKPTGKTKMVVNPVHVHRAHLVFKAFHI